MTQNFVKRHLPICVAILCLFAAPQFLFGHGDYKILVFTKTAGYRHGSIPAGISAVQNLGTNNHFHVDATEDATAFNDANLQQYKAVVFLSTTGDVLNNTQQAAFERFIQAGNGYVGLHAASDTEYDWPWYGGLVGAYFQDHPYIQEATIKVADSVHPSTTSLPERWVRTDEWYNFQSNPRTNVHVLATLDETSYDGGSMGFDHPTVWCHEYDGGRAWYSGGGHTDESYAEPLFLAHLLGGIEYAAGVKKGDDGATVWPKFQRTVLDTGLVEPMELAIAADGRVFYIERGGRMKIYKPQTSSTVVAGQLAVFNEFEDGLLGIALDPNFMTNHWVYLMYSPLGSIPKQHVSRFTLQGDTLDLTSEKVLLQIPTQRELCCHSAGALVFGPDGNLFISTGDNTSPFESEGFAPLDEQPERSVWDSQKSSANANDLRGKILRIRPEQDGTYSIPGGNLFSPTNALTKPEIYVMGCRNPFRISVDSETGWLYWGDVGPDAYEDDPLRGPMGYDEFNQARSAGNYGWPYFIANNRAYRDYDFATGLSGPAFNPAAPVNNSPNNTGPQQLPPARPAWIWYPYGESQEFPELGDYNSRTAFAGPVYHFNPDLNSPKKFPAYYDKTLFLFDMWRNGSMFEVKIDGAGQPLKINPFFRNAGAQGSVDMKFGPDGTLYLLEWGYTSHFLTHIEYAAGNYDPIAVATASTNSGSTPLLVQFSSAGSVAVGTNGAVSFAWSFMGNDTTNSTLPNPTFTYTQPGNYNAKLTVTDSKGNQSVANVSIVVGNNKPTVTIHDPPNGAFFDWSQMIHYYVSVSDVEDGSTTDGTIPPNRTIVESWLGHNEHAHSQGQFPGYAGLFTAPIFDPTEIGNLYLRFDASYLDNGATGVSPLKGLTTYLLQPKHKQAEYFTHSSGIMVENTSDPAGGLQEISAIEHGDWISFYPMNLTNITAVSARVASFDTGRIEIHTDSFYGPLIGTITVSNSSGIYTNFTGAVTNQDGTHELFFVFLRNPGDIDFLVLNSLEFIGNGVNVPIVLQSAVNVAGPYNDDAGSTINFETKTITVPLAGSLRFYRIRSSASLHLKSIQAVGGNVLIKYEP